MGLINQKIENMTGGAPPCSDMFLIVFFKHGKQHMETASLWSWVAQYLGKLATSAAFSPMDASNVSHFFNGLLEVKRPVRLNLLEPKFRNIEQRNMLFGPFHLPNINIFRICLVLWKMAKQENPANVPMIFYG